MSPGRTPDDMHSGLYDRVQSRLKSLGITARDASLQATGGQNADLIRNLKRGRSQGLKDQVLLRLSAILGVTPEWLIEAGNDPSPRVVGDLMRVPLIAWVHAGQIHSDTVAQDVLGELYEGGLDPDGDWVAMRVTGDSMDRISPPDSIIFVDRADRQLVPNACYVISDGNGTTYKRYRPNPMRFEPVSTNPDHEPMFCDQQPEIFGRVKKTILQM